MPDRIESETALLPFVVADCVCREAAFALRSEAPLSHADALADKAERIYARNARWRRLIRGASGREHLYSFMRHWLAGMVGPEMARALPAGFSNGEAPGREIGA